MDSGKSSCIMDRIQELCQSYLRGQISVEDFQLRLQPMLGDHIVRSKEDDEFINAVDNEIELIIYTVPKEEQKQRIVELFPRIIERAKVKDAKGKE